MRREVEMKDCWRRHERVFLHDGLLACTSLIEPPDTRVFLPSKIYLITRMILRQSVASSPTNLHNHGYAKPSWQISLLGASSVRIMRRRAMRLLKITSQWTCIWACGFWNAYRGLHLQCAEGNGKRDSDHGWPEGQAHWPPFEALTTNRRPSTAAWLEYIGIHSIKRSLSGSTVSISSHVSLVAHHGSPSRVQSSVVVCCGWTRFPSPHVLSSYFFVSHWKTRYK